jgi:predicted transcriptional regulator
MKLSHAEWQIMNALWDDHPATAREIAERLPPGTRWAYTTIKTMLARLVDKKAVSERKQGNTSIYEPALSRNKARRSALRTLADQAFDGAFGPLMHFLVEQQDLSPKQRAELVRALQQSRREGGSRR